MSENKRKFSENDKKPHYFKKQNRNCLVTGQKGFLVTSNFREKECARDCLKLLIQYADKLYGPDEDIQIKKISENTETNANATTAKDEEVEKEEQEEEDEDIATSLQRELDKHQITTTNNRRKTSFRFLQVITGVTNCQFFRTTLTDPVALAEHIVRDVADTRIQVSRFILRFIPIEVVCRASMDDIINAADKLFDKYFLGGPSMTYAIVFNHRYNNDIRRERIYGELADLIKLKNGNHKVDLKWPQKTVIVEVIKGLCCMSVVTEYFHLRKYNLLELALRKVNNQAVNITTTKQPDEAVAVDELYDEKSTKTDKPAVNDDLNDGKTAKSDEQTVNKDVNGGKCIKTDESK